MVLVLGLADLSGCSKPPADAGSAQAVKTPESPEASESPAPAAAPPTRPAASNVEEAGRQQRTAALNTAFDSVRAATESGDWDTAEQATTALQALVEQQPAGPEHDEFQAKLDQFATQIRVGREAAQAEMRRAKLSQAQQQIASGRLDDAQQSLRDVLTHGPTDEQRAAAQTMTTELERIRQARRQLKSWLAMLSSPEQREVEAAQSQLLQDPDTAAGMILESLRAAKDEGHVRVYLTTLRQLDRPDVVMPTLLELLSDPAKKPLWPLVAADLATLAGPAAGPALLKLAVESSDEAQQLAALEALATNSTPPSEAVFLLVPQLGRASPALQASILRVIGRAAAVHDFHDWEAQRNWPASLAPEARVALQGFPEWLAERVKSAPGTASAVEAQRVRVILGWEFGAPVAGLKVERAEAETPESPATALVDGVWNSVDPKTMWRHPLDRRGVVLLDLGASRVVTAVRIWNWNEPGGGQRGWKEVEVFVSDNPAELEPLATSTLLPAPGAADAPDFGCLIKLPAPTGRYVRLQAKSTWTTDNYSGLAEVQVLAVP